MRHRECEVDHTSQQKFFPLASGATIVALVTLPGLPWRRCFLLLRALQGRSVWSRESGGFCAPGRADRGPTQWEPVDLPTLSAAAVERFS